MHTSEFISNRNDSCRAHTAGQIPRFPPFEAFHIAFESAVAASADRNDSADRPDRAGPEFLVQAETHTRKTRGQFRILQEPTLLQSMRWETATRAPRPDRMAYRNGGTPASDFPQEEVIVSGDRGFINLPTGLDQSFRIGWDDTNPAT